MKLVIEKRNGIRQLIWTMAAFLILLLWPVGTKADLIFEPKNSFYHMHAAECERVEQNYCAEGPKGHVIIYKSPANPVIVDKVANGEQMLVHFVYRDMEEHSWAYVYADASHLEGWTPLDYLCRVYDGKYFLEKHCEELVETDISNTAFSDVDTIVLWQFPGSDQVVDVVTKEAYAGAELHLSMTYQDEYGREWGCLPIICDHRGCWVCKDNPEEEDFAQLFPNGSKTKNEAEELLAEGIAAAQKAAEQVIKPESSAFLRDVWMILLLVGLAVTATMLLLGRKAKHERF